VQCFSYTYYYCSLHILSSCCHYHSETHNSVTHEQEEQSGVTVSYYFICLLHLANEKGLALHGQEDLCDFGIAADPIAVPAM
jgi:Condensin complex subunit 2